MDTGGEEQELDPREHIIATATQLFTALGYDGTPVRLIADATGLDVEAITALVGDKAALYVTVVHRLKAEQRAMFDAAIAEFTPDKVGMHRLIDRYLDHSIVHPELLALFVHRSQADAADVTEVENAYFLPDFNRFRALFHDLLPAEADLELTLLTVVWCTRAFCVGGIINRNGEFQGPDDPAVLERFRRHLHRLTDQMFELDR